MAIYCETRNLLYIQVPGTGCSVAAGALVKNLDGVSMGHKHNTINELLARGFLTNGQLDKFVVLANIRNPYDRLVTYYQRYKGTWVIAESLRVQHASLEREINSGRLTAQQQIERLSQFERTRVRALRRVRFFRFLGFNTWLWATVLRWHWGTNSSRRAHMFPMLEGVDVVLRQETLEDSLNEVLNRLGYERAMELPRKNLTQQKKPFREYYRAPTRWLLDRLYGEVIEEMGYAFDSTIYDPQPLPLTAKGRALLS